MFNIPLSIVVTLTIGTIVDVGAAWFLGQPGFARSTRILIALLPLPANLVLVGLIVRAIRHLDEFLRKVHLEAIAVAFLLTGLAVFIYGYLQRAGAVPPLNFGIVWLFMLLFYGIGYLTAVRHYR